jgi:hypothetical protein
LSTGRKHSEDSRISARTIRSIEVTIEEKFFHRAAELLKDPAWESYRNRGIHGPKLAISEFAVRYTALLAWAFTEYVDLLWKALTKSKPQITWEQAEKSALDFVKRFFTGSYQHPWTGDG